MLLGPDAIINGNDGSSSSSSNRYVTGGSTRGSCSSRLRGGIGGAGADEIMNDTDAPAASETSWEGEDEMREEDPGASRRAFPTTTKASNNKPWLAIVTDPKCCDTDAALGAALNALERALQATTPPLVDLVIVRLDHPFRNHHGTSDGGGDAAAAAEAMYKRRVRRLVLALVEWSGSWSGPGAPGPAGRSHEDELKEDNSISGGGGGRIREVGDRLHRTHMKERRFRVVVSSALVVVAGPTADNGGPVEGAKDDIDGEDVDIFDLLLLADGVHVKESHRRHVPGIIEQARAARHLHDPRQKDRAPSEMVVVGMSCHSVQSAVDAVTTYNPDYLLVGTCYPTLSHPEKAPHQVEGPDLPGRVCRELERRIVNVDAAASASSTADDSRNGPKRRGRPIVLGIGGIDATNCGRIVRGGAAATATAADGVAVIRSVLAARNPAHAVQQIVDAMARARDLQVDDDDDDDEDDDDDDDDESPTRCGK
jgi:Thiamine monophosphate synthase